MKNKNILKDIEDGKITAQEGLDKLYPKKKVKYGKRASFIKLKVQVPEEGKGVNTFLRILFALPIPMIFARLGLRLGKRFTPKEVQDLDQVDFDQISQALKYSKGTMINVESDDANVDIRII